MDTAALAGLILGVGIAVFLLMGAPISVGVGLSATLAMFVILGVENGVLTSAQQVFRGINSFPLLAIPFFVLAGVIMNNGGIALLLINAAKVMVGRMPGSLAQTNVAANALFGSVSGSAVAAAAATADPLTEPNNALAATLVWASEPGILPTITLAALISKRAIPPLFMITPARTKNGMASRGKELIPRKTCWAEVRTPFSTPRMTNMARVAESPTPTLIGAPMRRKTAMPTPRMRPASAAVSMGQPSLEKLGFGVQIDGTLGTREDPDQVVEGVEDDEDAGARRSRPRCDPSRRTPAPTRRGPTR